MSLPDYKNSQLIYREARLPGQRGGSLFSSKLRIMTFRSAIARLERYFDIDFLGRRPPLCESQRCGPQLSSTLHIIRSLSRILDCAIVQPCSILDLRERSDMRLEANAAQAG